VKQKTRYNLLALSAIALGGMLAIGAMLRYGFSARDNPTAFEMFTARIMRHLAIPSTARRMGNPLPLTDSVLSEGRAHFADHCALCHGNDGKGETEIGRNVYPKAPDMSLPATQALSDGEIFYIIKNGVRLTGMPAWGEDTHADDESSWKLVHFIRHLPRITPEEIGEMKQLNPKTPEEWKEEEEIHKFLEGEGSPSTPPKHKH
jgi:cbb3-type cytochrome c oxidase subunit III